MAWWGWLLLGFFGALALVAVAAYIGFRLDKEPRIYLDLHGKSIADRWERRRG